MSDVSPPPAWLSSDEIAPKKRVHVQREAAFQSMVDRFLDRVVLQPFLTTGINHENELTDNARARARGRGVKGGVPDIYVCQGSSKTLWIECKWGSNRPSDAQNVFRDSLIMCGISAEFCWTMFDVLAALRGARFALHANADNLAHEYQIRAEVAVAKAEAKAHAPRKAGKPRAKKLSSAHIRRVTGILRNVGRA